MRDSEEKGGFEMNKQYRRHFTHGSILAWTGRDFNLMLAEAMKQNRKDYTAILTLARYAGLRLEECFRIDVKDAEMALETGKLFVKGKYGATRFVPINASIRIALRNALDDIPQRQKCLATSSGKTLLAMRRLQGFIAYHRQSFTDQKITFYGLRYTFALEQYRKLTAWGFSGPAARRKVAELLGEAWDNVPRTNLSEGDRDV